MLWLDGERLDGTCAPFDLRDRGLMLGDGVFDTAMVVGGQVVFGAAHLERLAGSCRVFGIPFAPDAVAGTVAAAAAEVGTGALRVTVTRGAGPRGLLPPAAPAPHVIVAAHPGAPATTWRPLSLAVTGIRRNETSPTARHKCLSYLDAIAALQEATAAGADEVVFRNMAGRAVCCATGNLFVVRDGALLTPPVADGILPGILRAEILRLARDLFPAVREQSLDLGDLHAADAVFVTNSLRLIAPALSLEGAPLPLRPRGRLGDLGRMLSDHIHAAHGVRLNEEFTTWTARD